MKWFKTYPVLFFLLGMALIGIGQFSIHSNMGPSGETLQHSISTKLHIKEAKLQSATAKLLALAKTTSPKTLFTSQLIPTARLFHTEGIALMVYHNDSLQFWSENAVPVEMLWKNAGLEKGVIRLKNGWYECCILNGTPNLKVVGLLLIKNEFAYQNNYLHNNFLLDNDLTGENTGEIYRITKDKNYPDAITINNKNGAFLFALQSNHALHNRPVGNNLSVMVLLCGLLLVVIGLAQLPALWFGLVLIVIRFTMIKFHWPKGLYELPFFSPQYYGDVHSFWLGSLGDLLLNTLALLSFAFAVNIKLPVQNIRKVLPMQLFISGLFLFAAFGFTVLINRFLLSLIEHSSINFNINSVFTLNAFSYWGLLIIALLQLSFYLIMRKCIDALLAIGLPISHFLGMLAGSLMLFLGVSFFTHYVEWIFLGKPIAIGLCIYLFKRVIPKTTLFTELMVIVLLFSIFTAFTLIKDSREQEEQNRLTLASKIASDEDALTEHLFEEMENEMVTDTILTEDIRHRKKSSTEFEKRLRQEYFGGYWDKYKIKISVFDSTCHSAFKSPIIKNETSEFYDELIEKEGSKSSCEHLYFIKNNLRKIIYIARIPLMNLPYTHLYVELSPRVLVEESGFPALLLDNKMHIDPELSNYSYAKFKNGTLVTQSGKYKYSRNFEGFAGQTIPTGYREFDGYNHLIFSPNPTTTVIISKPSATLLDTVTSFSYLFTFFSLIAMLVVVFQLAINGMLFRQYNFQYRIQFFLVLIVLMSLVLFGTGTMIYIKNQFERKNKESISEKINSTASALEASMGGEAPMNPNMSDYTGYLLKQLSSVFFTDATVFDLQGNIYASSQPKLFEEGLTSKKMNAEAFKELVMDGKTQFIHEESIGKLSYLSAYVPLKGKNGDIIAFLNLPYFGKQSELEKEIAGFLMALINIYVLLFALSILIAIFISGYITRPLRIIQDKLSKIQLGGKNEPIEWKERDEIGSLIKEYNRMISELAVSAELLAKSERETAWREMAKQVAHEIKNPLTPMRLSIQHLERMWSTNAPGFNDYMPRVASTLVEQIDALASIADAFSNFAIMPKSNNTLFNLVDLLGNTVSFFRETTHASIQFQPNQISEAFIQADKEQILRVFNNIIKNAIQSIPEGKPGMIQVDLSLSGAFFCIKISDNGCGIPSDLRSKIFTPNFTTKSTGMGLGLAMCRNIIESNQGQIKFETTLGEGTQFYVYLPAHSTGHNLNL